MSIDMNDISSNDIVVMGVPFDAYSSYLKGPAQAPASIRQKLTTGSANSSTETGVDLRSHTKIHHFGDITWEEESKAFDAIEKTVDEVVKKGGIPLTFGGDHSITFPLMKSIAPYHDEITILHFDAHPDLYDSFKDNPLSHACPFARIMERGLAKRLVQVGIRTLNQHQREQVERFGVEVHEMMDWKGPEQIKLDTPVYISIDIDALDPAYAPGVSHLEPGGMSVRQILDVIHSIDVPIIGADIVEYNPKRDINDMTAMVTIKLYKEVCGKILLNSR